MATPRLPLEIISLIFQKLSADTSPTCRNQTLSRCCLVSQELCSIAQPLLFSSINIGPENPLDDACGASLVQTLRRFPSLADSIHTLHLTIDTRESGDGAYIANLLPLVKHTRALHVWSGVKGRIYGSLSPTALNSLRMFWNGPQGYQLTHLTLKWILLFPFSQLHVPHLVELKLVYVYPDRQADEIIDCPKHQLRRLILDQFCGGTFAKGNSLLLFAGNSSRPLDSLAFGLPLDRNWFTVFGGIDVLLGQRKNALTHFRLDYPERHYERGRLVSFDLSALESLRVFEVRMEPQQAGFLAFLDEWLPTQLRGLSSTHPLRLLDVRLHEPPRLRFSKWMALPACEAWRGFDTALCDIKRKVQITFLLQNLDYNRVEIQGQNVPVICQVIQWESKAFIKCMLPGAVNKGLALVHVSFYKE
ncbi:hypothetical protein DL96DRAFT_1616486 [Flagelloscypha sp. PMI_526]|nr:hypothetical protein DL96DRAFT_1616486 [Flagelloscypha sp. PMI_526]